MGFEEVDKNNPIYKNKIDYVKSLDIEMMKGHYQYHIRIQDDNLVSHLFIWKENEINFMHSIRESASKEITGFLPIEDNQVFVYVSEDNEHNKGCEKHIYVDANPISVNSFEDYELDDYTFKRARNGHVSTPYGKLAWGIWSPNWVKSLKWLIRENNKLASTLDKWDITDENEEKEIIDNWLTDRLLPGTIDIE